MGVMSLVQALSGRGWAHSGDQPPERLRTVDFRSIFAFWVKLFHSKIYLIVP